MRVLFGRRALLSGKMIEGAEKLQIYQNAVDEFIKRHPEFNEELKEIIKQEEEESEEAEE